jgi:hypothetical protein
VRWLGGNNSVVECDLAKVEVAGSNPVSRSKFLTTARPWTRRCSVRAPPERNSSLYILYRC